MSRCIYIVPWAICDTENLYLKRVDEKEEQLPMAHATYDDWTVQTVMPSPDRRSKDIYIVLDVYRGYDFKNRNRDVSILDVTNSVSRLQELGYEPANENERTFIRQKILKWDKPVKKLAKKAGKSIRRSRNN